MKTIVLFMMFCLVTSFGFSQNAVVVYNSSSYSVCVTAYGNSVCDPTGATAAAFGTLAPGATRVFPAITSYGSVGVINQTCPPVCNPYSAVVVGPWASSFSKTLRICGAGTVTVTWDASAINCTDASVTIY